jgi:hypothetical protein
MALPAAVGAPFRRGPAGIGSVRLVSRLWFQGTPNGSENPLKGPSSLQMPYPCRLVVHTAAFAICPALDYKGQDFGIMRIRCSTGVNNDRFSRSVLSALLDVNLCNGRRNELRSYSIGSVPLHACRCTLYIFRDLYRNHFRNPCRHPNSEVHVRILEISGIIGDKAATGIK